MAKRKRKSVRVEKTIRIRTVVRCFGCGAFLFIERYERIAGDTVIWAEPCSCVMKGAS